MIKDNSWGKFLCGWRYTGLRVNTLPKTKQLEQNAGLEPGGGGEGCV